MSRRPIPFAPSTPAALQARVQAAVKAHAAYWRARGCEVRVEPGRCVVRHPARSPSARLHAPTSADAHLAALHRDPEVVRQTLAPRDPGELAVAICNILTGYRAATGMPADAVRAAAGEGIRLWEDITAISEAVVPDSAHALDHLLGEPAHDQTARDDERALSDAHAIAEAARLLRFRRHAATVRDAQLEMWLTDKWFCAVYPGVTLEQLREALVADTPLGRHLRTLVTLPVTDSEAQRCADWQAARRGCADR